MEKNTESKKNDPATWPDYVQEIITHFGSITKMAKELDCTRAAIYLWDGVIPEGRAYQIEVKSGGKFTAESILAKQNGDQAA